MSPRRPIEPRAGTKIGKYEVEGRIAVGGMAEIFLARAPEGGRAVIKRLVASRESLRDRVKMFIHEGRIATLLDHPNIVRVFEVDLDKRGSCFLAMEYLEGWDLEDIFYRSAKLGALLPVPIVLRLIADTCRGLQAAHTAVGPAGEVLGLVHRDISPANLFVTRDGVLKILDFGVAKTSLQMHRTRTGIVKGKPTYMSPEHIEGRPVDHRSDIFSVGIVFHELLSGQRLFARETAREVVLAVTKHFVPPPLREGEELDHELVGVCMRALQRDPSMRFSSAEQMADALDAIVWRSESSSPEPEEIGRHVDALFRDERQWQSPEASGSYVAVSRWLDAGTGRVRALPDVYEPTPPDTGDTIPLLDAEDTGDAIPLLDPEQTGDTIPLGEADFEQETEQNLHPTQRVPTIPIRRGRHLLLYGATIVTGLAVLAVVIGRGGNDSESSDGGATREVSDAAADGRGESSVPTPPATDAVTMPEDAPENAEVASSRAKEQSSASGTTRTPVRSARVRRPTVRKPAKATTGRLSLLVRPWANIYYGGKLLGASPLVEHEFPVGRVELRFENPSKGLRKTMVFDIQAGKHRRERIELE